MWCPEQDEFGYLHSEFRAEAASDNVSYNNYYILELGVSFSEYFTIVFVSGWGGYI